MARKGSRPGKTKSKIDSVTITLWLLVPLVLGLLVLPFVLFR